VAERGDYMEKFCEICGNPFTPLKYGASRKYCFECSPTSEDISKDCHHKTQLRRAMKKQAVILKGEKCSICGYNKCIDALQFHHTDGNQKEFRLSDGNIRSWDAYLQELEKCILVCANCHAEIHSINNEGL
jgi:hypothetical protein